MANARSLTGGITAVAATVTALGAASWFAFESSSRNAEHGAERGHEILTKSLPSYDPHSLEQAASHARSFISSYIVPENSEPRWIGKLTERSERLVQAYVCLDASGRRESFSSVEANLNQTLRVLQSGKIRPEQLADWPQVDSARALGRVVRECERQGIDISEFTEGPWSRQLARALVQTVVEPSVQRALGLIDKGMPAAVALRSLGNIDDVLILVVSMPKEDTAAIRAGFEQVAEHVSFDTLEALTGPESYTWGSITDFLLRSGARSEPGAGGPKIADLLGHVAARIQSGEGSHASIEDFAKVERLLSPDAASIPAQVESTYRVAAAGFTRMIHNPDYFCDPSIFSQIQYGAACRTMLDRIEAGAVARGHETFGRK